MGRESRGSEGRATGIRLTRLRTRTRIRAGAGARARTRIRVGSGNQIGLQGSPFGLRRGQLLQEHEPLQQTCCHRSCYGPQPINPMMCPSTTPYCGSKCSCRIKGTTSKIKSNGHTNQYCKSNWKGGQSMSSTSTSFLTKGSSKNSKKECEGEDKFK